MNLLKAKKGFTLIELLVVIAIIGILAALIIVSLSGARTKANDTQKKNNARSIDTALAQYYLDQEPQTYPATGANRQVEDLESVLSPTYLGTGAFDKYKSGSATLAKYAQATVSSQSAYAQAWELENQSETVASSGNGVRVAAAGGAYTAPNTVVVTAAGNVFTAEGIKLFVTYGQQ